MAALTLVRHGHARQQHLHVEDAVDVQPRYLVLNYEGDVRPSAEQHCGSGVHYCERGAVGTRAVNTRPHERATMASVSKRAHSASVQNEDEQLHKQQYLIFTRNRLVVESTKMDGPKVLSVPCRPAIRHERRSRRAPIGRWSVRTLANIVAKVSPGTLNKNT